MNNGYRDKEERCRDCPWKCNPVPEVCPISDVTLSIITGNEEIKNRVLGYVHYREMAKECGLDYDNIEIVKAFMAGHSKAYREIDNLVDSITEGD